MKNGKFEVGDLVKCTDIHGTYTGHVVAVYKSLFGASEYLVDHHKNTGWTHDGFHCELPNSTGWVYLEYKLRYVDER